jgi:calcineurin-like phosphoesterase family protein
MVVTVVGDQQELTLIGTGANGETLSYKYARPLGGGVLKAAGPVAPGFADRTNVVTVIDSSDFYVTVMVDGKQVALQHYVISKDGKMRLTIKGKNPQGTPVDELLVYDKSR